MPTKRTPPGGLGEYARKRTFASTPEPPAARRGGGEDPERAPDAAALRFVVHEHHARRLHWDLRLEHDGALASWAIPNGIPEDPRRNRKAVHVEDHPLDYIDFHGTIPAGNYGAGEVRVWDHGTYDCEKWRPDEVIAVFHGERLRGRYALFQAGRDGKDWMIHRMDQPVDASTEEIPDFIEPMLARLSSALPTREQDWAFEVKWDGVRAIARSEPGRIRLLSRNRNDITIAYPELRALNRDLGSHAAILDGEIVAFDRDGRPSFEALQGRMHLRGESAIRRLAQSSPVTYMIFDLLWLDGHSLTGLPYSDRRARLAELELAGPHWQTPEFRAGEGSALLEATREQHLEGVLAKRMDSTYEPGARNGSWLKVKNVARQEFVIGGWTAGKGTRASHLGALELGVHDTEGRLRYAGRVGTGFDARELDRLARLLAPLERLDSPFEGAQPPLGARFARPELVCEVEFGAWTRDGLLRHSAYKGLREDKPAASVLRELPQAPEEAARAAKDATAGAVGGSGGRSASSRRTKPRSRPATGPRSRAGRKQTVKAAPDMDALIDAGRPVRGGVEVELEGRTLKLTNLEKVLYPETGFTKADLIAYYTGVSPALLRHLRDRPLTLKRYPDGVEGKFFYEKDAPSHRPEWVQTLPVSSRSSRREVEYCLCQDLPTLVWLANLAAIELHPSLSRAEDLQRPTTLAFDLDPGAPAGILECCEVALELEDLFSQLSLAAFPKASGSKGLQVYVPLNDPDVTYAQSKPFAHALANLLEERRPELVVSRMTRATRRGKVLIDWSQNDPHKTTVSVYSLRARPTPSASAPLDWDELRAAREHGDEELLRFAPDELLARLHERGDLFEEVQERRQQLPDL